MSSARYETIAELVVFKAQSAPDFDVLTFVEVAEDGQLIDEVRNFAALYGSAEKFAVWLSSQGLKQGDCFAIMLQNHPEFVEAMIAASLVGAIFVPLDPRSQGDKLVYMLNTIECEFIIAGDYALDALDEVCSKLEQRQTVVIVGDDSGAAKSRRFDSFSFKQLLTQTEGKIEPALVDPQSTMFMMFTSGTTGNPKAVERSHASYIRGVKGLVPLGVERRHTLYTGLPLCHINAQSTLAMALSGHQKGVFSRRFTKSKLWDICRAYDCNVFTLLGGMIPEIFSVQPQENDPDNPVEVVITSGMPVEIWDKFRERFKVEISEVYGSTEAGGVLYNPVGTGPVGSMGKPPPGLLAAILDEGDTECSPGVAGEICFRPEGAAPEQVRYFRNTQASADKVKGGWYRSGDIGHMDADGWFYFHYRAGGGIRRNGDFVNPAMVEGVLVQHPNVADAFVYGVQTPHTVAGEKDVVAALVLNDGSDVGAVKAWCEAKLQKNEVPQVWQMLDSIPKTVSQKPIERECIRLLHDRDQGTDCA